MHTQLEGLEPTARVGEPGQWTHDGLYLITQNSTKGKGNKIRQFAFNIAFKKVDVPKIFHEYIYMYIYVYISQ